MSDEKYQYSLHINQRAAIDLGIKNANQAIVFEYLTKASVWATPVVIGNQTYYWVHRKTTSKQLPLLGLKRDSVYRHYKHLAELGLIDYKKHKGMDCIRITQMAKSYFFGHKTEIDKLSQRLRSEINPNGSENLKAVVEKPEKNPSKPGIRSDILVNTNIRKTTTTNDCLQNLAWPPSIPNNVRPSIIKLGRSRAQDEVQLAIDEIAGRLNAGRKIASLVGYFKSLLEQISDGNFTPAYAMKVIEKRRSKLQSDQVHAMNLERSEKARLAMLEQHERTKKVHMGRRR